jgi:hypothetical protein
MSKEDDFREGIKKIYHLLKLLLTLFLLTATLLFVYISNFEFSPPAGEKDAYVANLVEDEDRIENGIHVRTGFIEAEGLMEVVNNCTNCHSAKLVIQNRMNAERWNATIEWMQETQNLWDLGGNQEIIVNYLVSNYPPQEIGRRAALTNIEWYELED